MWGGFLVVRLRFSEMSASFWEMGCPSASGNSVLKAVVPHIDPAASHSPGLPQVLTSKLWCFENQRETAIK